jgi:EAL domain-containing protein (putative c-di-GMP-specific phosphodiesterase class I)
MESRLRDALERGELGVHYQPRFDLRSRRLLGAEALLRWHNGELGDVPPSEFIPIAEESGLIVPIGKWVLREACLQAVAWDREGFAPLMLSVNLSARQFADRSLVADIAFVLRETGLPARRLELEITEGTVVQDVDRAVRLLDELKGLGLRLAIDDFGTGYSSLGQLKRFPIDTLKVDRSFIRDLPNDAEDAAITHAIIAMGKSLGMTVVAEGVETKEQEAFLRSRGCDEVQGFLMGRPALAEDFVRAYLLSPFAGGPPARVGRAQEKRRIAAVTSV